MKNIASNKNIKSTNCCKVCENNFFTKPLLRYKNMPRAAQYFPDSKSLTNEQGVDMEVYQCSGCGLVQLNNQPVPYYREVIRSAAVSEEMTKFRKNQFLNFIEKFRLKNKKILEVGCGHGEFLSIMQKLEVKTYGLEQSKSAVKHCISQGLNVSQGYIENSKYDIDNAPFDGFLILSFLEHLPNINSALRGIYNNLIDGGIGLVEVPNFDMILQKNLFSEFISDHLFYFTKDTLKTTLKINGFEVIDCSVVWYGYIISAVVKKIGKMKIEHFYQQQDHIMSEINKYINCYKEKKVAIWGAGHQALAIISLANLSDKICYVIDSAVFKQNKYTPATHVPIVSPKNLVSEPPDAVIIIAASYSDEVAKNLMESFDSNLSISILRDNGLEIIRK